MSRECFFISCVLLLLNLSLGHPFNITHNITHGFQDGHVRLVGGRTPNEGRVEVYYDGQWGTVCDDDWDIYDATVVCQYLNFSEAVSALDGDVYGGGTGPILLDDVRCRGDEADLSLCESNGWGNSNCQHTEDAGVVCKPVTDAGNYSEEASPTHAVNHGKELSELLGALFDSGRGCDLEVAVEVNDEPSARRTVCIHKLIFTLDESLAGSLTDLSINVTSNCSQYVTSFVRYLYTRQINITWESLQCIHGMASDWGLNRLREETGRHFSWVLPQDPTFETQISLYEYSVRTANEAMQQACLRYLAWNFEGLVRSPIWTAVPLGTVRALLSRSDLVVPSESEVLHAVANWEEAHATATAGSDPHVTGDPFDLLRHVRFPMISAEGLYRLQDPRYQAGRLLGFQFAAMRFGQLLGELVDKHNAYTPRIYTGKPWSFTFDSQEAQDFKRRRFFFRNHTRHDSLDGSFSVPVYGDVGWSTVLAFHQDKQCTSVACVAATLAKDPECNLPSEVAKRFVYENKLVVSCAGRHHQYVFHVQDFNNKDDMAVVPDIRRSAYPCNTRSHIYQVVVRPKFIAGLKDTEEEQE